MQKSDNNQTNSSAWYTQPLVWMVIMIPLSSVIVGGILLTLSITSFDGLVVDDYYQKGKEINVVLKRDQAARKFNVSATLDLLTENLAVVTLEHDAAMIKPARLQLNFLHPTRAGLDQTVLLSPFPDGSYKADIERNIPSQWLIQLETGDWRLTGQTTLPAHKKIRLEAL